MVKGVIQHIPSPENQLKMYMFSNRQYLYHIKHNTIIIINSTNVRRIELVHIVFQQ